MALIVQHFKQNKIHKVYICSDKQMWIKKGEDLYADAIDFEGQEAFYSETDIPLFPEEQSAEPEEQEAEK